MSSVFVLLVVPLLLLGGTSQGYPDGAPDSSEICGSMRPTHYLVKGNSSSGLKEPMSGKPYFSLHLDRQSVSPGQNVIVTIKADELYFEGFIVQARSATDNSSTKAYGTFHQMDDGSKIICSGTSITHAKHEHFNNITFHWTAPQQSTPQVKFVATVVKGYSTFFMNVASEVVMISSGVSAANFSFFITLITFFCQYVTLLYNLLQHLYNIFTTFLH